jgi:hypothetical protein
MKYLNHRFGRLVTKEYLGKNKHKKPIYLCMCDCGNSHTATLSNLRHSTKSCGCLKKEVLSKTDEEKSKTRKRKYAVDNSKRDGLIPNTKKRLEKELKNID